MRRIVRYVLKVRYGRRGTSQLTDLLPDALHRYPGPGEGAEAQIAAAYAQNIAGFGIEDVCVEPLAAIGPLRGSVLTAHGNPPADPLSVGLCHHRLPVSWRFCITLG